MGYGDIGPNRRKYKPNKCVHSILGIVYSASTIDYISRSTHKLRAARKIKTTM